MTAKTYFSYQLLYDIGLTNNIVRTIQTVNEEYEKLVIEESRYMKKKSIDYVVRENRTTEQFYRFVFEKFNFFKTTSVYNWEKIFFDYCKNHDNSYVDSISYEVNKYFGLDIYYEVCKCYKRINEDIGICPTCATAEGEKLHKVIDLLNNHKKFILDVLTSMVSIEYQHLRCGLIEYFYNELKRFCFVYHIKGVPNKRERFFNTRIHFNKIS